MESYRQSHIDRGWAWVIVIASFGNIFLMIGIVKSTGLLVEEFITKFGVSTGFGSMTMSVAAIVYGLASPISILLTEHYTVRHIVMVGGFAGFIGMSISSLLLSMGFVIGFFGISLGIGNSTIYGSSAIMIGNYFEKKRTLANGLALAGASIGQFTMPPLIQFLIETYGLNGTLLMLGALYFHVTLFGSLLRSFQETSNRKLVENDEEDMVSEGGDMSGNKSPGIRDFAWMSSTGSILIQQEVASDHGSEAVPIQSNSRSSKCLTKFEQFRNTFDFRVLKLPASILYITVNLFAFIGYFNFILFLPLILTSKGVTGYNKALLLSICGIGDLIGRISSGIVGDLNIIERYKIKACSIILVGVAILCFLPANNFPLLGFLSCLYGLIGGIYVNYKTVVLIDFIGLELMPKVLAILFLLEGAGACAGQPFFGWTKDVRGDYDIVIYTCGVLPIIGGILLLLYPCVKGECTMTHQIT